MKFGKREVHEVKDGWVDKFFVLIPEPVIGGIACFLYFIHLPFCSRCRGKND